MVLHYRGPRKLTQREGQVCGTAAQQVARDSQLLPRPGGVGKGGEEAERAGKFAVQTGISRGRGVAGRRTGNQGRGEVGGQLLIVPRSPVFPGYGPKCRRPTWPLVSLLFFNIYLFVCAGSPLQHVDA